MAIASRLAQRAALLAAAAALALLAGLAAAERAAAQQGPTIIRDDEVAAILDSYAAPLLAAAGLRRDGVDIHVVRDSALNAYVTAGNKMVINTGVLRQAEDAGEVLGVMAHEIAHLAGGHLVRLAGEVERAQNQAVLSTLLGIATAVGTGRGDAGAAIAVIGQDAARAGLASYSRGEERAADRAAVTYLREAGLPTAGLVTFMADIADQALLSPERQPAYLRTHPNPRDRVQFLRQTIADGPEDPERVPAEMARDHARLLAKLNGFLETPSRTLRRYADRDDVPARYARAIATYRQGDEEAALATVDTLIADRPEDPHFHGLRGQILFETGRSAEAATAYREAVTLAERPRQLRIGLARALIAAGGDANLQEARTELRAAVEADASLPYAWRQLAIVEGRLDNTGQSALALAEEAALQGRDADAQRQARRALELLPAGSSGAQRARDIVQTP